MTDLTSLGYPQGYHLGFSAILWWIFIIVTVIQGVILYLNAIKSELINVKEMFRAKFYLYICTSIQVFLIQVGVFFPDIYLQIYITGGLVSTISLTFYFYFWEKNLTRIKHIPTIFTGITTIIYFTSLIISLFIPDMPNIARDFLTLTGLLLTTISSVLYISLIFIFSRNVKGGNITIVGWIWIGGMIIVIMVLFLDNPPGVSFFPELLVYYFLPIMYIIGYSMTFYGITKLFPQISSFYTNIQRCAVHRGTIEKGNPIHYCPSCGIVYCEKCFNQVIKKDGCWNCRKGIDLEDDKEQIIAQVLEKDIPDKLRKPQKKETSSSPQ